MIRQLMFAGQQIGDGVVKIESLAELLTPPVYRTGLFQDHADVDNESRNLLPRVSITVYLLRVNEVALTDALWAIQRLLGTSGSLSITENSPAMLAGREWVCERIEPPLIPDGFGGRYVSALTIVFVGKPLPP